MTFEKPYYKQPLKIGDALAYGRKDMDRLLREILVTEGIHIPRAVNLD